MGTRSLTKFIQTYKDGKSGKIKNQKIASVYRQFDGYPSGHGLELAEFLTSGTLVNGIGGGHNKVFNGVGCMAAQMVAEFKDGAGGIYLRNPSTIANWEDYEYLVYGDFDTQEIRLKVRSIGGYHDNVKDKWVSKGKTIFDGTPAEFLNSKLVEE